MTEPKDLAERFLLLEIEHSRDFNGRLCGNVDCTMCQKTWEAFCLDRGVDAAYEVI